MTGAEIFGESVVAWLSTYGYIAIIPLLIFEGTTTGFIGGALASVGVFNPFILFGVMVGVRIVVDTIVYMAARHGSDYLKRFKFARSVLEKLSDEKGDSEIRRMVNDHFWISLFLAKVLPAPSLDTALLIAAGTMNISLKRVYAAILTGQPIWSGMVVALGYFFAGSLQNPGRVIDIVGFGIGVIIVGIVLYNKYVHNYLLSSRLGHYLGRK